VHDLAKWSGLTITDARRGLDFVKTQLQNEVVDGQSYWFATNATTPNRASPIAHLLSIYDEYVSSYQDRSALGDAKYAARLRAMGNALTSIIVIDGQIVGTWKRTLKKDAVVIETNLFAALTEAENQALDLAVQRYGKFLELPALLT
jgi:hypothetical protein